MTARTGQRWQGKFVSASCGARDFSLLFQFAVNHLGVLLVALENLQAGLQQALELAVIRRRNELRLERAVHGLMVGDLIVDIGLVERGAVELGEVSALGVRLLGQGLAGGVVFRLDLELIDQASACLFTAVWSRTMSSAKARTSLFLDFASACLAASISSWPAV